MIVMQLNKNELEMRAWSSCFGLGKTSIEKKRFLSGIARIS